jgi:2-ketoarginine methyltransferase
MWTDPVELRLIEAIQPIRFYVLATSIYHLFDTGIFDIFSQNRECSIEDLVEEKGLDPSKLSGFLKYLRNEGIVAQQKGRFSLTAKGKSLGNFRGWYTMLIGGYGQTFLQVGEKLEKGTGWARRDATKVGIGSCGISYYDAIPLTCELMAEIPEGCRRLLDLGCGNGLYLVEFCKALPEIEAWGVEPDEGGYRAATELVRKAGLQDRIKLTRNSAVEFLRSDFNYQPDFVVMGFVLHEILSQEGEEGVVKFLLQITKRFPDIYIIVLEVDLKIDEPTIMQHGLSLAYYNPYYLLHYFTNQRLESQLFWEKLFARCQLEIVAQKTTDILIDSTNLEIGYLLKRKE